VFGLVQSKQEIQILCKEYLRVNMKVTFFVLFLLIISSAQTISNEDEGRSLIQSKEQVNELNGTISLPFQTSTIIINVSHICKQTFFCSILVLYIIVLFIY
jgi:hypothetical protein